MYAYLVIHCIRTPSNELVLEAVHPPRQALLQRADLLILTHTRSWFKHKPPNFVRHECRMQQQLECHILRSIWYHADRHEQWNRVT